MLENLATYMLTTARLDATGQRMITSLVSYTFSLHYKTGKTNIDADSLSWIVHLDSFPQEVVDMQVVKAIANVMQFHSLTEFHENPNLLVTKSARPVPQKFTNKD